MNVFIDTHVFVTVGLNVSSNDFDILREYVERGAIRLYSTTVTMKEIESHVAKKADEIHDQIKKLLKLTSAAKKLNHSLASIESLSRSTSINKEIRQFHKDFFAKTAITVVGTTHVNIDSILDKYFSGAPPFNDSKKKHEFPDALAAAALESWCLDNNQKMLVVSGDSDWKAIADSCSCFEHYSRLVEVFEIFPNEHKASQLIVSLKRQKQQIVKAIAKSFKSREIALDEVEPQVLNVAIEKTVLAGFHVLKISDKSATVEIDYELVFRVRVKYMESDSWVYDSEEGRSIYLKPIDETVERVVQENCRVDLRFESGNEVNAKIVSTSLPDEDIWITGGDEQNY